MTDHAANIASARDLYITATAAVEVFREALAADYPEPDGSCDDTWEAWNEVYENAYADRGGYRLDAAKRVGEDELIRAMEVFSVEREPATKPAFDKALGRAGYVPFKLRRKVLDLGCSLDLATI